MIMEDLADVNDNETEITEEGKKESSASGEFLDGTFKERPENKEFKKSIAYSEAASKSIYDQP